MDLSTALVAVLSAAGTVLCAGFVARAVLVGLRTDHAPRPRPSRRHRPPRVPATRQSTAWNLAMADVRRARTSGTW